MAVKTYSQEFESSVSSTRIFKALCVDSHILFPKLVHHIKSIEFLQGDCATPGSIKLITYVAEGKSHWAKHRIDEVDMEKLYYKYTMIEGDKLREQIESVTVEVKIEAKGSGSIAKGKTHFHIKGDAEIDEEILKVGKEKMIIAFNGFKVVEEYLQANPDVYA